MLETKRARGFFLFGLVVAAYVAYVGYSVLSTMALGREVDDAEAAMEESFAGTSTGEVQTLFDEAGLGAPEALEELDQFLNVDGREPFVVMPEGDEFVARYRVTAWGGEAIVEARWSGEDLEAHEVES